MPSPQRLVAGLSGLALSFSLACSTAPVPWREEDHQPKPPLVNTSETEMPTGVMKETDIVAFKAQGRSELDKALNALRGVKVLFALDEATLTPEATDRLSVVAGILNRHADLDVSIQGNADERGTAAHNQLLGQQRADGVKAFLASKGVKPGQVKAVSFGDANPADPAHTEEAYSKNRRADVVAQPAEPAKK